VYAATKAADRYFARTWTTDLKERKIRVNAVSPSSTDTDGLREAVKSNAAARQRIQSLAQTVHLGRLGRVDEIAKAVLFLNSDDSSFITGAELFADGGMGQV
jgi:NAD(P)-dependent dehydrogenase (short-subunit alcohol dehydrogenase family)